MNVTFGKYPDLKNYLQVFTESMTSILQIRSIILFGGIMLDDFSQRYSDIDIIVVLDKGLKESDLSVIDETITDLRKLDSEFTKILYVYFIPACMFNSSKTEQHSENGLILGNEKTRKINQFPLSVIDNFSIREKGKILFGEDLRNLFPKPPKDCFWSMFTDSLPYIEEATKKYPFQFRKLQNDNSVVNWLLYFPRMIYSLINEDLIGKSDSAFWFQEEYNGLLGEFLVEVAKCRQENCGLDIKDLVKSSRELLLFSLERAFEVKDMDIPNLKDLVNIKLQKVNFKPVFRETRKLLRKKE